VTPHVVPAGTFDWVNVTENVVHWPQSLEQEEHDSPPLQEPSPHQAHELLEHWPLQQPPEQQSSSDEHHSPISPLS
jgi:hypothetical protein